MTKEQWKVVETELSGFFGDVTLMCDGFELGLICVNVNRRLEICIFVNGKVEGAWALKDCEERRRFHRPVRISAHSSKFKKSLKDIGKKTLKKHGVDLDEKLTCYTTFWPTFKPLKAHLIKNNPSIELVKVGI